ncbi:transmembrane protein [Ceratobasidium sp. AG-Ba]|nr:transmembrane protein [Ceratobasidium sp. AG-Ba]
MALIVVLHVIYSALLIASLLRLDGKLANIRWLINSKDVITGMTYQTADITWDGTPRTPADPIYLARGVKIATWVPSYMSNVLFRRISPVEARPYAFVQNTFALLALAVILARAVVLSLQPQGQTFETQTSLQNCGQPRDPLLQLLVKHPGSNAASPRTSLNYSLTIDVQLFRTIDGETILSNSESSFHYID